MKPVVTMIVARLRNGAIGRAGGMPFHIPADLRHFKASTMGKPMIMGRKTFDSLPGGALPGRRNIVVTRNENWSAPGAERASSVEEALAMCHGMEEVMVCGGGEIYRRMMPVADRLIVTEIDAEIPDGDTFSPKSTPLCGVWQASRSRWLMPGRDCRSVL